ncbi:hypothetical protein [Mycoplasmopsis bovigenitalium]|nr:hypothetical protein [Mycoplasmopsis bovigenitalium]
MKNKRILILASATTFLPLTAISCTKTKEKEVKKVEEENKNDKVMNPSDQPGAQSSKPGLPGKNGQKDQKPNQGQSGNTNQDGLTKQGQSGNTNQDGLANQGQSGNNQQDGSSANNADNGRVQQDDPMSNQENSNTLKNNPLSDIKEKYKTEYEEAKSLFSDEEDKAQITELESINKTISENSTVQDYETAIKKINELLSKYGLQEDPGDVEQRPLEELKAEFYNLYNKFTELFKMEGYDSGVTELERIGDRIPAHDETTLDYENAIQKLHELIENYGYQEDNTIVDAESSEAI